MQTQVYSADENLGLVYVPTGNATPDYFGATRTPESEKYASSVVALEADTGRVRWSYQIVHHDLWDYDVGSQPMLVDLPDANGTTCLRWSHPISEANCSYSIAARATH